MVQVRFVWRLFDPLLKLGFIVDRRFLARAQIKWMKGLWDSKLDDNASDRFDLIIWSFTPLPRYADLQSSSVQLCCDKSLMHGETINPCLNC